MIILFECSFVRRRPTPFTHWKWDGMEFFAPLLRNNYIFHNHSHCSRRDFADEAEGSGLYQMKTKIYYLLNECMDKCVVCVVVVFFFWKICRNWNCTHDTKHAVLSMVPPAIHFHLTDINMLMMLAYLYFVISTISITNGINQEHKLELRTSVCLCVCDSREFWLNYHFNCFWLWRMPDECVHENVHKWFETSFLTYLASKRTQLRAMHEFILKIMYSRNV